MHRHEWSKPEKRVVHEAEMLAGAKALHNYECGCRYEGEHSTMDILRWEHMAVKVLESVGGIK